MTLEISPPHLQQIYHHATIDYPQECCGLIVGKIVEKTTGKAIIKQVVAIHPMQNAWTQEILASNIDRAHSKQDRYAIDPSAMLQVMKQSRAQGLEIIGIYHSHPDHCATPSECDRQLAWPQYTYLIVSVQQGQDFTCNPACWCLDSQGNFQSEAMQILTP